MPNVTHTDISAGYNTDQFHGDDSNCTPHEFEGTTLLDLLNMPFLLAECYLLPIFFMPCGI